MCVIYVILHHFRTIQVVPLDDEILIKRIENNLRLMHDTLGVHSECYHVKYVRSMPGYIDPSKLTASAYALEVIEVKPDSLFSVSCSLSYFDRKIVSFKNRLPISCSCESGLNCCHVLAVKIFKSWNLDGNIDVSDIENDEEFTDENLMVEKKMYMR